MKVIMRGRIKIKRGGGAGAETRTYPQQGMFLTGLGGGTTDILVSSHWGEQRCQESLWLFLSLLRWLVGCLSGLLPKLKPRQRLFQNRFKKQLSDRKPLIEKKGWRGEGRVAAILFAHFMLEFCCRVVFSFRCWVVYRERWWWKPSREQARGWWGWTYPVCVNSDGFGTGSRMSRGTLRSQADQDAWSFYLKSQLCMVEGDAKDHLTQLLILHKRTLRPRGVHEAAQHRAWVFLINDE